MSFFGGSNKSSTTTNVTTTTANSSFSEVAGPANAIQGSNNTVNQLDGGAIKDALAFAANAGAGANQFAESVNSAAMNQTAAALDAVAASRKAESENITSKLITYGSYVAIALAVAHAFGGKHA